MSEYQQIILHLNEASKAYQKEKSKAVEKLKVAMLEMFKELIFNKFPKVETIGWTQYTPHFNDGDPCYFSAHTDYDSLYINGESFYELDCDDNDEDEDEDEEKRLTPEEYKSLEEVLKTIEFPNEDVLQDLFDEGLVVFTRDETYVEDYYHD